MTRHFSLPLADASPPSLTTLSFFFLPLPSTWRDTFLFFSMFSNSWNAKVIYKYYWINCFKSGSLTTKENKPASASLALHYTVTPSRSAHPLREYRRDVLCVYKIILLISNSRDISMSTSCSYTGKLIDHYI